MAGHSDEEQTMWLLDGEDDGQAHQATSQVSVGPGTNRVPLLVLGAAVVAIIAMLTAPGSSEPEVAIEPTPTTVEQTVSTLIAEPVPLKSEGRAAAEELLLGNRGLALTMCNGLVKHFDDTPDQVRRARQYADCLAGFEVAFQLPNAQLHVAYPIPPGTEPAVLLRCGEFLTGPDVSTAAFEAFKICAEEARVVFGLT